MTSTSTTLSETPVTMPPLMYSLPLSASLGEEADYSVPVSSADHLPRFLTANDDFWSPAANSSDMYTAPPGVSSQASITSPPNTVSSSSEEQSVAAPRERTFIHLSPSDHSRIDPSPSTSQSTSDLGHSRKRPREPDNSGLEPIDREDRRQRNTEAARRYRQRKMDRLSELEEALSEMKKERDEFKMKLARSEAEVDVLRGLIGKKM